MRFPKPGELVELRWKTHPSSTSIYPHWNASTSGGIPDPIGKFGQDDLGVVLESLEPHGGNGCRVLLKDGQVGWVNLYEILVVQSSTG